MNPKPEPRRIFLARHGESEANRAKLISGRSDPALSEKGKLQAHCLCDVLRDEQLSAIYATGLTRTMATAAPVAAFHGKTIQILNPMQEIDLGHIEGTAVIEELKSAEALRRSGRSKHSADNAAEGETLAGFKSRIIDCLDRLLEQLAGTVLIVGHRNTNEIILRRLLGESLSGRDEINIKNKYLYEIVLGERPRVNTIRLGGEFHGKKFTGLKDD